MACFSIANVMPTSNTKLDIQVQLIIHTNKVGCGTGGQNTF